MNVREMTDEEFEQLKNLDTSHLKEEPTVFDDIRDWADKRDLLKPDGANRQVVKLMEELGETCRAILKGDQEEIVDGLGDTVVVLTILAKQLGLEIPRESLPTVKNKIEQHSLYEVLSDVAKHYKAELKTSPQAIQYPGPLEQLLSATTVPVGSFEITSITLSLSHDAMARQVSKSNRVFIRRLSLNAFCPASILQPTSH